MFQTPYEKSSIPHEEDAAQNNDTISSLKNAEEPKVTGKKKKVEVAVGRIRPNGTINFDFSNFKGMYKQAPSTTAFLKANGGKGVKYIDKKGKKIKPEKG